LEAEPTPAPLAAVGQQLDPLRALTLARACLAARNSQHDAIDAPSPRLHAFPIRDALDGSATHILLIAGAEGTPWDTSLDEYLDSITRALAVIFMSRSGLTAEGVDVLAQGAVGELLEAGSVESATLPPSVITAPEPPAVRLADLERIAETDWGHAVIRAIQDGAVLFDSSGLVLEINSRFTDLLDYSLDDGPLRPPYPWWPTVQEDAEGLAAIRQMHEAAQQGVDFAGELRFFRRDRQPLWVSVSSARVTTRDGRTVAVCTLRDVTRQKEARERRTMAAQISADFSSIDDFDALLAVAENGFNTLFDGNSTTQIIVDDRTLLISGGVELTAETLPEQVRVGLAGKPNPDTTSLRPGILLVPRSSKAGCRAWIQFPRPRRIRVEEMIVADLLAQAFALAVDRFLVAQEAADRESNLQIAVQSHRMVGQAIGILIERHRISPTEAFARLKAASQNRNLKLRELARRVIETGQEPLDA
ncbi:ANTAR domain-containing protein, partial [Micropruina sp.]|uniref:ANTAR domain-containing protein n=1 Tax=Micropruina sp. TaxID=2737536 RepID=UPI0039E35A4D